MSDASERGWGPGWPTLRVDDMVSLRVAGADFPGGVHFAIHDLMEILLLESVDRGYQRLTAGWCWGYAYRPIKRSDGTLTDVPSNHSWGIALDINAPQNPFGGSSHTIPLEMGMMWSQYGFRWGGDYSTTKDWMHFEYIGARLDVGRHEAAAREDFMQDERLDQYDKGESAYKDKYREQGGADPGPPGDDRPVWFKKGWNSARFAATNPHGE